MPGRAELRIFDTTPSKENNVRSQIIDREIAAHAATMGDYHGEMFAEHCRRAMTTAAMLAKASSAGEIQAAVAQYAKNYAGGVADERKRIQDIDSIAAQLLPGNEAMVRAAKFETHITAGELATQIVSANRRALEMPRRAQ